MGVNKNGGWLTKSCKNAAFTPKNLLKIAGASGGKNLSDLFDKINL